VLRSFRIRCNTFYFCNIGWIGDSGGHRDHVRVQVCGGATRVAPELLLQDVHDLEVGYVVFIVNVCAGV
jgi:hypothetical protein